MKDKQLIIRKGSLEDLTELQELFVDTIKSVCKADYNNEQINIWVSSIRDTNRWNEIISNQLVIVAELENRIVGFATLKAGNYIDLFYVHKAYQRLGIARKLYNSVQNKATELNQREITSDVSITAKPFFEILGFEVIKKQTVVRKQVNFTNFKMRKKLLYNS